MSKSNSEKFIHLEWARGIASIIVVFHHFVLAYLPALKAPYADGGLKYTPAYALMNGNGAVIFFFVLSGFVLSYGYFRRPSLQSLVGSVIKRLPRLMLPAGLSILIGLLILGLLPPFFEAAGAKTGSPWLAHFGNAFFPEGFQPGLADALRQSLMVFLHENDAYYNTNLWTMNFEFYGSMIVFFGLMLFSMKERGRLPLLVFLIVFPVWFALFNFRYVPFFSGMILSYLIAVRGVTISLSGLSTALLLLMALFGFMSDDWISCNLGSVALMVALLGNKGLAARFSGVWSNRIGILSFPLYLVHTLVIVSVTSALYVMLDDAGVSRGVSVPACLIVTLIVAFIASLPFIYLEKKWVPLLNSLTKRLTGRLFDKSSSTADAVVSKA